MAVSPDTAQSLIRELYLIGRAIRVALLPLEAGHLLPGGVGVLGALESKDSCRQGDLAVELCLSPSALSRHVAELAGAGYVSRHADPTDGRATLLQVTDEGRLLLQRVRASGAGVLETVLADWQEGEAEQAYRAVHRLRNSLTAHAHRGGEHKPMPQQSREAAAQSQGVDV